MINSLYIDKIGLCPVKWDLFDERAQNRVVFSLDADVDISHPDNRKIFFEELFIWISNKSELRTITVVNEEEDLVTEFKGSTPHSILFADLDASKVKNGTQEWGIEFEAVFRGIEYSGMFEYCKRNP